MISSEVQRTLVKSPPELWTELSDPESLARHLGELGEITITRTEPETLVEWEAEGTTGTVEITPSGWGTRVTLTVSRELPEEPAETAQAGGGASEASAAKEPDAEAVAADEPDAEAVAAEEPDAEAIAENEPDAEAVAENEPDAEAVAADELDAETEMEPEAEAQQLEAPAAEPVRRPAPATEAARRAAGWPGATRPPGPAIESDLRAAEATDGPPAEPHGLEAWAAQSTAADEAPRADEPAEAPERRPEPRRGFFARLFGRRRRAGRDDLDQDRAAGDELPEEPLEPALDTAGFAQPGDVEEYDTTSAEEPGEPEAPLEEELAADEPGQDPMSAEPKPAGTGTERGAMDLDAALQALGRPEHEALGAQGADESEAADATPAAQESALVAEAAEAQHSAAVELETDAAGHGAVEEVEAGAAEHRAAEPGEVDRPQTPVQDLATELRAAEEVAAEQVEAVLTAVLDRLGSAHHRPFSRP